MTYVLARYAPPGAVVRTTTDTEYVRCWRIPGVMRWGQPIPDSENWMVRIVGQLPNGEDLTDQEKVEVDEAQRAMLDRLLDQ